MDSEKHVPRPRVIVAYGTRPEKIKLAPVTSALRERGVEVVEWCSGQSADLVTTGNAKMWKRGLITGIGKCMRRFEGFLTGQTLKSNQPPDAVVVQGDTATAFACAQAAFLARVPVAHVEAGMRTYQSEPWPEEAFRRQIAAVARWHFCPSSDEATNLRAELGRHRENDFQRMKRDQFGDGLHVHVVGNTIIDTLPLKPLRILVTLHRRENWGARRQRALRTLLSWDDDHDAEVTIVRHPNGREDYAAVEDIERLLVDPLTHESMLDAIQESDLIVTDSGGLQEEAAHFGIPCIVLRTSTERVALERLGAVTLVDPDDDRGLERELGAFLSKRRAYGEGDSGKRIAEILVRELTGVDSTTAAG